MTKNENEKKLTNDDLYCRQKTLLDTFLAHHTISREQYKKSLGDLTAKMYPDKKDTV